jgi:hypothetical protein
MDWECRGHSNAGRHLVFGICTLQRRPEVGRFLDSTSGTRTCCSANFPQEISTTGIDTGAMAVTLMLQEYAALTNLVAQQPDRDTL